MKLHINGMVLRCQPSQDGKKLYLTIFDIGTGRSVELSSDPENSPALQTNLLKQADIVGDFDMFNWNDPKGGVKTFYSLNNVQVKPQAAPAAAGSK